MIGTSPEIRGVFSLIRKVAATDVPVLITGESGAGKELTALAIHQRSLRRERPFVPINCSAIPVDLLESELFGHERGAFTGATTLRRGRLEAANGGTLFLDEIGDLASTAQVKLLRFLEDHVVERVGGSRRIPLDVRVVAATHRNLLEAIETGEFREDLYYRLAVFTIQMPALRDRGEDSLLIARVLLDGYARQAGKPITGFSRAALDTMRRHAWPGNVRELINRLRRAVTVAEGANLTPSDLGFEGVEPVVPACSLREARLRAEREAMGRALEQARGNRSEAARMLGISRTQLYELMRRQPREL
jgi:DNA-binding NtrC family response regulator